MWLVCPSPPPLIQVLQLLEKAGVLKILHCETAVSEVLGKCEMHFSLVGIGFLFGDQTWLPYGFAQTLSWVGSFTLPPSPSLNTL